MSTPALPPMFSIAPLGKNEVWVGPWLPGNFWDAAIVGAIFADKAGVLHIEQGGDGETVDVDTAFDVAAGEGEGFEEPRVGAFWRLRYENGAAAQGIFRIHAQTRGGK